VNGRDLVVWYNLGFHHVTRPEDWPVLPTVRHSLTLRPHRFFVRNPGMEVARDFEPPRDRAKR
jgi:primary-amine oxidase